MAKIKRFGLQAFLLIVLLVLPFSVVSRHKMDVGKGFNLDLRPPEFVQKANAGNSEIGQYLDSEAGISAYYQSPDPINLDQARSAFRTIETETADYIIGSVAVPNYIENFDAHVYVHETGWILSYYLNTDPVSKIIDVKARTINTTLLKTVVSTVANAAGVAFTDVTYYDFRYPNATNILFVGEDEDNGNNFTIELPSSYGYYEYGWSYWRGAPGTNDSFSLDGVNKLSSAIYPGYDLCYGKFTASEMLADTTHTIAVFGYWNSAYGVLLIVYRMP